MAVAGYEYRVDGGAAQDVSNVLTEIVSALAPDTFFDFEVRSYDVSGNRSAWTSVISQTTAPAPARVNWAKASNSGVMSSSSELSGSFIDDYTNDGTTVVGASIHFWASNGKAGTQWLKADLGTPRPVDEIIVTFVPDDYASNPTVEPDYSTAGTLYHLSAYVLEYSDDNSAWTTIATITGNTFVKKQHTFTEITSAQWYRVRPTATPFSTGYCVVEMEVIGFGDAVGAIVVCEGDSFTHGNAAGVTVPYPDALQTILGVTSVVSNIGTGGHSMIVNVSGQVGAVQPYFDAGKPLNVLVLLIGINDFISNTGNAAAVYAAIETYCDAVKAAGWEKIIVCTVPQVFSSWAINSSINSLNALLIADFAFADALYRIDSNTLLNDSANATYRISGDTLPHWNDAANALFAQEIADLIATL